MLYKVIATNQKTNIVNFMDITNDPNFIKGVNEGLRIGNHTERSKEAGPEKKTWTNYLSNIVNDIFSIPKAIKGANPGLNDCIDTLSFVAEMYITNNLLQEADDNTDILKTLFIVFIIKLFIAIDEAFHKAAIEVDLKNTQNSEQVDNQSPLDNCFNVRSTISRLGVWGLLNACTNITTYYNIAFLVMIVLPIAHRSEELLSTPCKNITELAVQGVNLTMNYNPLLSYCQPIIRSIHTLISTSLARERLKWKINETETIQTNRDLKGKLKQLTDYEANPNPTKEQKKAIDILIKDLYKDYEALDKYCQKMTNILIWVRILGNTSWGRDFIAYVKKSLETPPHKILEVAENATKKEVLKARRKALSSYHPDKNNCTRPPYTIATIESFRTVLNHLTPSVHQADMTKAECENRYQLIINAGKAMIEILSGKDNAPDSMLKRLNYTSLSK